MMTIEDAPSSPLADAEKRLFQACLKLGMTPQSAAVSAFVNSIMLGAKIDALAEYVQPFELDETGTPIMKATLDELLIKHLGIKADGIDKALSSGPRLVSANGVGLNG
jgi:hypothetical protein